MTDEKNISPVGLGIHWIQSINEMLAIHEEIIKLRQQRQQFKVALNELEQILSDAKAKRITRVLVPTIGGHYIQVSPSSKKYKDMLLERKREYTNSIKGIEGQITHREDNFHEMMMKIYRYMGKYLVEHGLNPPELEKKE